MKIQEDLLLQIQKYKEKKSLKSILLKRRKTHCFNITFFKHRSWSKRRIIKIPDNNQVPYPNKNDRWTNAKREKDQEWYYWQTAVRLVQAYGRSIRSKDDWAKTYVLDSAFEYFVRKSIDMLPDWFVDTIRNNKRRKRTNHNNNNDQLTSSALWLHIVYEFGRKRWSIIILEVNCCIHLIL
jgi:hypothetical protein